MTTQYQDVEKNEEHILQAMRDINALELPPGGRFIRSWNTGITAAEIHAGALVWVSDFIGDQILIYTLDGISFGGWGSPGTGDGQFLRIAGMAGGPRIWVSDAGIGLMRIQEFSNAGAFIAKWGSPGTGDGQFNSPSGIAYWAGSAPDSLFVVDSGNNRIQAFQVLEIGTPDFTHKWGSPGTGDGQFNSPKGIAVNPDSPSEVFVADRLNHRVQAFTTGGTFIRKWGSQGAGDGEFFQPTGIDVSNGKVYVTDEDRVQVFTTAGIFLSKWGSFGVGEGEFDFANDVSIAAREVYVTDVNRVQVFTETATVFFAYPTSGAGISLGEPDEGVSIPSLTGLTDNDARIDLRHISDMRTAIENLATLYINPATGNPYTEINTIGVDNLWRVAIDLADYGGSGTQGGWGDFTIIAGMETKAQHIGEIRDCITQLEASELV